MNEPKYTVSFSSILKPITSEEKDKYLSKASLEELRSFIPTSVSGNKKLLAAACNVAVANRFNKNGDGIDTKAALAIADAFIHTPINVSHARRKVVGVVVSAGFSEFGTDKPLDRKDLEATTKPFNITLGLVLWKMVSPEITEYVEDSNDPFSDSYMGVAASWEIGFYDYSIAYNNTGSINLEDCEIYNFNVTNDENEDDDEEIDKDLVNEMHSALYCNGGSGRTQKGKYVYRLIKGEIIPLGMALTSTPAADVKGVAVEVEVVASEDIAMKDSSNISVDINNSNKNSSQTENDNVNKVSIAMRTIEKVSDITDEALKEVSASTLREFLQNEIKKTSEDFVAKKQENEKRISEIEAKKIDLEKEMASLKDSFDKIKADYEGLKTESLARENQDKFNGRMSEFEESFNLDKEDREILASRLKSISDEEYSTLEKDLKTLLRSKKKSANQEKQSAASVNEENKTLVIEAAVDNAKNVTVEIPNTAKTEELTLKQKYAKAFALDQFVTKTRKRN